MLRQFQNEYYYHICNRGVDRRKTFLEDSDYYRFIESLIEFNSKKPIGSIRNRRKSRTDVKRLSEDSLVQIIAYCLNPNHFHLILGQNIEGGISELMKRLGGYTKYFNKKYHRSGSLFQGVFKCGIIKSTYKLIEMSLYVNGNYEIHGLGKAIDWPWSSLHEYLGKSKRNICQAGIVMNQFENNTEYIKQLNNYIANKKEMKIALREMEY